MARQVISLDTNYLILALVPGSREGQEVIAWAQTGEPLVTSAVSWYEFLCGPVSPAQVRAMRSLLRQILPFDEPQAAIAAQLFAATGRRRSLRVDGMIAATAIAAAAALATNNRSDFAAFTAHGLKLA